MKKKPEIIEHYNRTKGGVDVMDKMAGAFSVKRKTLRWPVAFFYNIIDVAAVAAFLIYKTNNPAFGKKSDARRTFLKGLGKELAMASVLTRSQTPTIYRNFSTRVAMESVLGRPIIRPVTTNKTIVRDKTGRLPILGNCYKCLEPPHKNHRKTRKQCSTCRGPICTAHSTTINLCPGCSALPM